MANKIKFFLVSAVTAKMVEAYRAARAGRPTIRGRWNEKALRDLTVAQLQEKLGLKPEEAERIFGVLTVDLSRLTYEEMLETAPLWARINEEAAQFLVDLLENEGKQAVATADLSDPAQRNYWGGLIHAAWLANPANAWAKGGELDRPFGELPLSEQEKDLDNFRVLQVVVCENYDQI